MSQASRRHRVAVVGAGRRAGHYFRNIPADLAGTVDLVALADPDVSRRHTFSSLYGGASAIEYDSGAELLAADTLARLELDALIIATPNHLHAHNIIDAVGASGAVILAEKPVAVSIDECAALWSETEGARDRVLVGFVLRYVPFYERIRDLIADGAIGEVLAIDCDETLGTGLTGVFQRGWRSRISSTGGLVVEKCCHDLDILNWLVSSPATRVFSMANRQHFRPRLGDEQLRRFIGPDARPEFDYGDRNVSDAFAARGTPNPYECASEMPDRQQVMIEFANGTLCTLTVALAQPHNNRRIRVFGTTGSVIGNLRSGHITITTARPDSDEWDDHVEVVTASNESGHYGGDQIISNAFWRQVAGDAHLSRAGLREGIEAIIVGAGAEQSAATGAAIDLTAVRRHVFGDVPL